MKNVLVITILCLFSSACATKDEAEWKELFNGKDLQGWDTYLGPTYDSVMQKMDSSKVPGLNNDPDKVFSVVQEDGGAMRISGSHFGGISTKQTLTNFHLQLQFKWGTQKWNPRKDKKRDSGLLYFAVGDHGADYGFWMRSQEFQIQEGDCGDYWGVAGGIMDIPATGSEREKYVYDKSGELREFSETSPHYRRCNRSEDAELPWGQWNTIDLYCFGDTAVHVMNGKTVMVLYNSRQIENGVVTPLKAGKIQLQSEGAELFYRNIKVKSIDRIPENVL